MKKEKKGTMKENNNTDGKETNEEDTEGSVETSISQGGKNTPQDKVLLEDETSPTQEEINWKKFREKRKEEKESLEKSKKETDLLKKALSEIIEKEPLVSKSEDVDEEESEENRIKRLIEETVRARESRDFPNKLRQAFSDFDDVCTTENIEYLEFKDPELATALKHMPDGFEKWSIVYGAVKKRIPQGSGEKEKRMMEANSKKPRASSIPGSAQLGNDSSISYLSDDRKSENWKKMQSILAGK